ncbi:hypothetical protein IE81DRAFT_26034 [Ceraceosorus guamensis]|uniref:Uncharacterized protein n=1 Tax=Ceraceosorus guamensis TaxID=1522189 RepID=A0A316VSP4_9BASI|nr:hypothetical protein IE81DRAFT_26034 [Ceraceosorus guamensis]PWN39433.1 hypothetical protein IE81DRAFT_26034 [Ceraceosorus guamensis]
MRTCLCISPLCFGRCSLIALRELRRLPCCCIYIHCIVGTSCAAMHACRCSISPRDKQRESRVSSLASRVSGTGVSSSHECILYHRSLLHAAQGPPSTAHIRTRADEPQRSRTYRVLLVATTNQRRAANR